MTREFTLAGLRNLHANLVDHVHKPLNDEANSSVVVEALRAIAEMVVYGDNKSELLFDFFCEKNVLALFLEIMWVEGGCPVKVHVQILQTLSILVNCVRNDTSLYYLLSNNYINEIIIFPHDFTGDEALIDQYVSFMKSLSLRLDKQTIQFFFQEETGSFPLLNKAIDLLDFPDPMVRTAAQSTILNVYSVNEPRARQYALQDEVMHKLFTQIVKLMESKYLVILFICRDHAKAVQACENEERTRRSSMDSSSRLSLDGNGNGSRGGDDVPGVGGSREVRRLEQQLESHLRSTEDWLFYLQDIFGLQIMRLRRALVHHLMTEWVYPTLLAAFLRRWSASKVYGSRIAIAAKLRTLDSTQLQQLALDFHEERDDKEEDDDEDEEEDAEDDALPPLPAPAADDPSPPSPSPVSDSSGALSDSSLPAPPSSSSPSDGSSSNPNSDNSAGPESPPAPVTAPATVPSPLTTAVPMQPLPMSRRSGRKYKPTLASLDEQEEQRRQERDSMNEAAEAKEAAQSAWEEGNEDEDAMALVASLLFLTQMLGTISDRMMHRAIVTALLHPLSRRGRKAALEAVWAAKTATTVTIAPTDNPANTEERDPQEQEPQAPSLLHLERNPYRDAMETLLKSANHRLSLLAAGLLSSVVEGQVGITLATRKEEANSLVEGLKVDAGLWLVRCVGLWPLKASSVSTRALEREADSPILPSPETEVIEDLHANAESVADEDKNGEVDGDASKLSVDTAAAEVTEDAPASETVEVLADASGTEATAVAPAPLRPRLRTESLERERAAAKGLDERNTKERDDLDDVPNEGEQEFIIEPDIMNLDKLVSIASLLSSLPPSTGPSSSAPNSPVRQKVLAELSLHLNASAKTNANSLITSLLDALSHSQKHTLITVQVLVHVIYDAAILAFLSATGSSSTVTTVTTASADNVARTALNADTSHELTFITRCITLALQKAANVLLARLPSPPTPPHAGSTSKDVDSSVSASSTSSGSSPAAQGTLLYVLQEELRRAQGRKWSAAKADVLSNTLLFFPPSAEIVNAMGIDFDVPICQMETIRREVQVFLLLHTLRGCLARLAAAFERNTNGRTVERGVDGEHNSTKAEDELTPHADDLLTRLTSPDLQPFTSQGLLESIKARSSVPAIPANPAVGPQTSVISGQYVEQGQLIDMKGKRFLDARVISGDSRDGPASRTSSSKRRSSGGASDFTDEAPASSSFSMTSYLFGYRRSPSPSTNANASASARPRLGPVFFIQHDFLLVLVAATVAPQPVGSTLYPSHSATSLPTPSPEDCFEAVIVTPLLCTEALQDALDKKRLRLIVRSWDAVANMDQVGLEHAVGQSSGSGAGGTNGGNSNSSSSSGSLDEERSSFLSFSLSGSSHGPAHSSSSSSSSSPANAHTHAQSQSHAHSFLLPRPQSALWQTVLQFDSEQSCSLAREHIETRAAALRVELEAELAALLRGLMDNHAA